MKKQIFSAALIGLMTATATATASAETPNDSRIEELTKKLDVLTQQVAEFRTRQANSAAIPNATDVSSFDVPKLGGIPLVLNSSGGFFISGTLDGGIRVDNGTTSNTTVSVASGLSRASRLTFEGYKELGDGLRGVAVLESGMAIDTGIGTSNSTNAGTTALTWGRTSSVGIGKSSVGYLTIGRQYTPIWSIAAGGMNDPFGGNYFGGVGTIYSASVKANNSIVFSKGYNFETMLFPAPSDRLSYAVMYSPGETAVGTPQDSGRQYGFNVAWGDSKLWVGFGYNVTDGVNASTSVSTPSDGPSTVQQVLGASYDFGFARLHVGVNRANNGLDDSLATSLDRTTWDIGATVPIDAKQSVRVLYGAVNDLTAKNANYSTFQLAYQYDFTKLMTAYAITGNVANNPNSAVGLGGTVGTAIKGGNQNSSAIGIRYLF